VDSESYHIRYGIVSTTLVWVPKYRCPLLTGPVGKMVWEGIQAICGCAGCELVEMNAQKDHVRLTAMVPPKVAVSGLMGRVKGQTSINVFKQFRELRKKPYWGNHFWSKGYCVDAVGLDSEMIRKYVRYQEQKERQIELLSLGI